MAKSTGAGVGNVVIPPIADPLRFVKSNEDPKGSSKAAADLA